MNATSSGRDANDSEETISPVVDGRRKTGIVVPSASIVEGVAVMVERPVYDGQTDVRRSAS